MKTGRGSAWACCGFYDVSAAPADKSELIPLFSKIFTIDYSEVELNTRLLDMTVSSGGVEGTNDLNPDKMIPKNILADDGYEGDIEHYFTVTGWVPYNSKTFDLTLAVDTPLSLFVYTESGIAETYYTLIMREDAPPIISVTPNVPSSSGVTAGNTGSPIQAAQRPERQRHQDRRRRPERRPQGQQHHH